MSSPSRSPRNDCPSGGSFIMINELTINSRAWIRGQLCTVSSKDYKSGNGKLLTAQLNDQSGSVKVIIFTNDIHRFEKMFIEGAWVRISGYTFEDSNFGKQIKLSRTSSVFSTKEFEIPVKKMKFIQLVDVASKKSGDVIDIIGVILEIDDVKSFDSKSGQSFVKRSVIVIDKSESKLEVNFWGEDAEKFVGVVGQSICIIGGKLTEFNKQLSLNVPRNGFTLNPELAESSELIEWFKTQF